MSGNPRIEVARRFVEVGLISEARFKRLQIHESYWVLRDGGASPERAQEAVAASFGVSEDTVQVYSRARDRYRTLDEIPRDDPPPQS